MLFEYSYIFVIYLGFGFLIVHLCCECFIYLPFGFGTHLPFSKRIQARMTQLHTGPSRMLLGFKIYPLFHNKQAWAGSMLSYIG